ncbi:MAG: phosphatidylglycerophosphatase A [Bdellovibrionaceae bacterium]|nr:phosphatidylglycerophosphatase A [Pseudobdellovibrionaceae bacterium]
MKQKIIEMLATGFYIGKMPKAPGTWGTLLGIPVVWLLKLGSPMAYMLGAIGLLLFAVAVCEIHEVLTERHDSGQVVIDEVVGFVITMTWIPLSIPFLVAGFVVFRFFDIFKPFPIGYIDKKIRGGLGTVLDDVAAGLISNVVLQLVYQNTVWLGEMWNGHSLG